MAGAGYALLGTIDLVENGALASSLEEWDVRGSIEGTSWETCPSASWTCRERRR